MHAVTTRSSLLEPLDAPMTPPTIPQELHHAFYYYRRPLIVVLILSIAARGQVIFLPLYSIDSYRASQVSINDLLPFLLQQGRFGAYAVARVLEAFNMSGMEFAVSAMILSTLLFALS